MIYVTELIELIYSGLELYLFALQINAGRSMELVRERGRQPVQPNVIEFDPQTRQFIIRDYWQTLGSSDNYMWSLPAHFLDNKVRTDD